jgi:mRNA interferase RelE/StbE
MKAFRWRPAARADLRRIDQETAMRILHALTRYGDTGEGDVKMLTDTGGLYRLRVGKWRVFFDLDEPGAVSIHRIDNRGQAY